MEVGSREWAGPAPPGPSPLPQNCAFLLQDVPSGTRVKGVGLSQAPPQGKKDRVGKEAPPPCLGPWGPVGSGPSPLHGLAEQHNDLLLHVVLPGGLHRHHGRNIAVKTSGSQGRLRVPSTPWMGGSQVGPGEVPRHGVASAASPAHGCPDDHPGARHSSQCPLGPPALPPSALTVPCLGASPNQ